MTQDTRRGQRGDTIVEVLICVLIVSVILSGAYVTVNLALKGVRNAQEHAEASKLIQSQIEQIRDNAGGGTQDVFSFTSPTFCMVGSKPSNDTDDCKQDAGGQASADDTAYQLAVSRTDIGNSATFKVEARWNEITGRTGYESMFYRLRIGSTALPASPSGGGALVDKNPCIATSTCPGPPAGGAYHYDANFVNRSNNPPGQVTGCLWEFGDGTTASNTSCLKDEVVLHTYPKLAVEKPYPQSCYEQVYQLKLTVYFVGGGSAVDTYGFGEPECH